MRSISAVHIANVVTLGTRYEESRRILHDARPEVPVARYITSRRSASAATITDARRESAAFGVGANKSQGSSR